MGAERWRRLDELFAEAAAMDGSDRADLLARLAADDAELAEELETLLTADAQKDEQPFEEPSFAAAPEGPDGTRAGTQIGEWLVVRPLAEGGMGEVLLAHREHRDFEQVAALKLLRETLRFGSFAERFARERRTLAGLDHPHIAPLLDGGETEDGRPWLATRYVDGLPLDQYVDEHKLGPEDCARLLMPVCAAVHYAHQRLVVHRDLKPANILVTAEGQPILLDFGIAKLLDADGTEAEVALTQGVQVMTPAFASPEQIRGEPVSTASDIYSLGVVLYRLVSGALPQDNATAGWERSKAIAEGTLTPVRSRDARVSVDLDAILRRALATDSGDRYPSALAFSDDLDRYLHGLPVDAQPPTVAYRLRRFIGRNRWPSAFAAAALIAIIAGTLGVLQQQRIALQEAKTTARVSAFLVGLFDARDPWGEGLSGITLADIFDRGIQLAREDLEEEPEVRAEMLAVLGTVLRNLGEEERAAELIADALKLDPGLARRSPERHADRLFAAGVALHRARRWDEAREVLEDCLAVRVKALGDSHEKVASARNTLGLVLWRLGEREAAIAELEAALEMRRALLPANHEDLAVTHSNLAAIALADGDAEEAVRRFTSACDVLVARYPAGHPDCATAHNNLGMALHAAERELDAERELLAGLQMREQLFPDGHPHLAGSHNNVGLLYFDLGRLEEARDAFATALAMAEEKVRVDHPLILAFADNLAAVDAELAATKD